MPLNLSNKVHGDIDRQLQPLYRTWGNFPALIVRYFPALLWPLTSGTAGRRKREQGAGLLIGFHSKRRKRESPSVSALLGWDLSFNTDRCFQWCLHQYQGDSDHEKDARRV